MAKPKKKPAPKKKPVAKKKPAAKVQAAAKVPPLVKKPAAPKKTKFVEPATASEALIALAKAYAEARAELPADANDRLRAAYAVTLTGPAREPDVATAERASGITFPADYRALLLAHDGARFAGDLAVLATNDWIMSSELIRKGRAFVTDSVGYGATELTGCVPIANLGQPNDWLLYDPAKQVYQYCLNADFLELKELRAALARKARIAIGVLQSEG